MMTQADIKNLSTKDLEEQIAIDKEAYNKLKINHSVSPIENPANITLSRKTIARLQTELTARKAAEANK